MGEVFDNTFTYTCTGYLLTLQLRRVLNEVLSAKISKRHYSSVACSGDGLSVFAHPHPRMQCFHLQLLKFSQLGQWP